MSKKANNTIEGIVAGVLTGFKNKLPKGGVYTSARSKIANSGIGTNYPGRGEPAWVEEPEEITEGTSEYSFQDFPIVIENSVGSERHWGDPSSKEHGITLMHFDYGYIKDAIGSDGEEVDVYIGADESAQFAYVVHQTKKPEFTDYDEDKVMLGFSSEDEAKAAYLIHYNDERFYGGMSSMPIEKFREKVSFSDGKKITNEAVLNLDDYPDDEEESEVETSTDVYKDLCLRLKSKFLKKNIPVEGMKFLGKGSFGKAYELKNGNVLKITSDQDEALTSNYLKGKKSSHIVSIFDVFRFSKKDSKTNLYCIYQEKLQKLSESEASDFDGTIHATRDLCKAMFADEQAVDNSIWQNGWKHLEKTVSECAKRDGVDKSIFLDDLLNFQMNEILDELHKLQIDFADFHAENLMKKGSKFIIIDLGARSRAPDGGPMQTLEKSIPHLSDVDDNKFEKIKEALRLGFVEITEKIDGSARVEISVKENKLCLKTKHGVALTEHDEGFGYLRESLTMLYYGCLQNIEENIVKRWPKGLSSIVCEVLYGDVPNTLVYGGNGIVVHGFIKENKRLSETREYDRLFNTLFNEQNQLTNWTIYKKRKININIPEGIFNNRKLLESYLLNKVNKLRPSIGSGDIIEGIVIRNIKEGNSVKVVNKNLFTALNKFMWEYRELLERGINGKSGISKMIKEHTSRVLNCKTLNGSDVAGYIGRNFLRSTVDESIEAFCSKLKINENTLSKVNMKQFVVTLANLSEDWRNSVNNSVMLEGREFKLHESVIKKTNEAFTKSAVKLLLMNSHVEKRDVVNFIKEFIGYQQVTKLKRIVEDENNKFAPPKPKTNLPLDKYTSEYEDKIRKRTGSIAAWPLGKGTQGIAYELANGKVLKITQDSTEAKASHSLVGKNTTYILKVFDVFRFKDSDIYGIVQEKYTPLNASEKQKFNRTINILDRLTKSIDIGKYFKDFEDLKRNLEYTKDEEIDGLTPDQIDDYSQEVISTFEEFGVDMMMSELSAYGIQFKDWHAGNIMKRGSQYVLIDLGYSKSKAGGNIPVLEKMVSEVIREALVESGETGVSSPTAAKDILTKYSQLLARKKKINILNAKQLGSGTQGTAFDIGGNKVLKITGDAKEAKASMKITGENLKFVSKVFDVFKFRDDDVYGIVLEKLTPLDKQEESKVNSLLTKTRLPIYIYYSGYDWDKASEMMFDELVTNKLGDTTPEGKAKSQELDDAMNILENTYNFKNIFEELKSHGVKFHDFSGANLMKRGDQYVVTDIGLSKIDGAVEPPILEAKQPESIGLTIGRFQPFHKGHASLIRNLAKKYSKVVVLIAGNKNGVDNPFSYDLRVMMMKQSLPDLANKLEVHIAEMDGKSSGFVPGIISNMIEDDSSSINDKTAVNVVVGPDRYNGIKQQFEKAAQMNLPGIDLDLINVEQENEVKDGDDNRISGTQIRKLLSTNDDEKISSLFDPHLASNKVELDKLIKLMKKELISSKENKQIKEDVNSNSVKLSDVGEDNITKILKFNAERLKVVKSIDVNSLKRLGNGEKGIAYQHGGEVLKITVDSSEAESSSTIKGKSLEHVVKINDVWKFKENHITTIPLFAIKEELLTPLSESEKGEIRHALNFVRQHEELLNALATKPWDQFELSLYKKIEEDVKQEIDAQEGSPRYENLLRKASIKKHQIIITKMKQFGIDKMSSELQSAGVQFADYHEGNLMKRGSNYVINDLGASKSGGGNVPVLEKLNAAKELIMKKVLDEFSPGGNMPGATQTSLRAGTSSWSNSYGVTHGEDDDKFKGD